MIYHENLRSRIILDVNLKSPRVPKEDLFTHLQVKIKVVYRYGPTKDLVSFSYHSRNSQNGSRLISSSMAVYCDSITFYQKVIAMTSTY